MYLLLGVLLAFACARTHEFDDYLWEKSEQELDLAFDNVLKAAKDLYSSKETAVGYYRDYHDDEPDYGPEFYDRYDSDEYYPDERAVGWDDMDMDRRLGIRHRHRGEYTHVSRDEWDNDRETQEEVNMFLNSIDHPGSHKEAKVGHKEKAPAPKVGKDGAIVNPKKKAKKKNRKIAPDGGYVDDDSAETTESGAGEAKKKTKPAAQKVVKADPNGKGVGKAKAAKLKVVAAAKDPKLKAVVAAKDPTKEAAAVKKPAKLVAVAKEKVMESTEPNESQVKANNELQKQQQQLQKQVEEVQKELLKQSRAAPQVLEAAPKVQKQKKVAPKVTAKRDHLIEQSPLTGALPNKPVQVINDKYDVIRFSRLTHLFHACPYPPSESLWITEQIRAVPMTFFRNQQDSYASLGKFSPSTLLSFKPSKQLNLFVLSSKNLAQLWEVIQVAPLIRLHLWENFPALRAQTNNELECTLENMARIVFGVRGGMGAVLQSNPHGGCLINPTDGEQSFEIQRTKRPDFEAKVFEYLCDALGYDGYEAPELALAPESGLGETMPSQVFLCDPNWVNEDQMFAVLEDIDPQTVMCADSVETSAIRVASSGGADPANVLVDDTFVWQSSQGEHISITLEFQDKVYADQILLELEDGPGGTLEGSEDGKHFVNLVSVPDTPAGTYLRTFRAALRKKIHKFFRFRANGPVAIKTFKPMCGSYVIGGTSQGLRSAVEIKVQTEGIAGKQTFTKTVDPLEPKWKFDNSFDYQSKYEMSVISHHAEQTCVLENPLGLIVEDIDDVVLLCSDCVCSGEAASDGSGAADCNSTFQGAQWCYVKTGVCDDGEESDAMPGWEWSFTACLGQDATGPTESVPQESDSDAVV